MALFRAGDRLFHTTTRSFRVIECRRCRLIRLAPMPTPRELPAFYPPNYWYAPEPGTAQRLEESWRRLVLGDHVRFVRRALAASGGGPVLDVGCGGGLFLRLMAEAGASVVGLDFSLPAAEVAWHRYGVPAVCASLSRAPVRPESCAVVTMFHVLEHLYEPQTYVEAAREVLLPDGRLVIQVPNAASWQFLMLGENWSGLDVPRHLFDFRLSDIEVLLDRCGFEPVRCKHFSLRDNPAMLATSLAPSLDPMARLLRGAAETPRARLFKDLLYFALVVAALPVTAVEAACRAGATVMVEARKKK